jgi:hypothetical protein
MLNFIFEIALVEFSGAVTARPPTTPGAGAGSDGHATERTNQDSRLAMLASNAAASPSLAAMDCFMGRTLLFAKICVACQAALVAALATSEATASHASGPLHNTIAANAAL